MLVGCGRIDFDARVQPDAPTDCWAGWRAGTPNVQAPQLVPELADAMAQGDPSLASDDLELFVTRGPIGSGDIYHSTRPDRGSPWSTLQPVTELNTASDDLRLSVGRDGTAVFSSSRGGSVAMYSTSRGAPDQMFAAPTQTLVTATNMAGVLEHNPELSEDELTLYFAPIINSSNTERVSRAIRPTTQDPFGAPSVITEIQILVGQGDASISPDELVIVFAARDTPTGGCVAGMRCFDLFFATRASKADPFGAPIEVPNVNSFAHTDNNTEISSDGCELYFASQRAGNAAIYRATVTP